MSGETIDFKVDNAGDWISDGTGINATVTFTPSGSNTPPPPIVVGPAYIRTLTNLGQNLFSPTGIVTDQTGAVFVSLYGNDLIVKLTSTGLVETSWSVAQPTGIAMDAAGDLYVTEIQNHRVGKYTNTGSLISFFGTQGSGDGEFETPMDVAVDGDGYVYVADRGNNRIQKFTAAGSYVSQWRGLESTQAPLAGPSAVAVDQQGHVYVTESSYHGGFHRVIKFMADGTYLSEWGSAGSVPGQFGLPRASPSMRRVTCG